MGCVERHAAVSLDNTTPATNPREDSPDQLESRVTNSIGMKLVRIPAGRFLMGSAETDDGARDDEKPQHQVQISRPFYMGAYEVTQLQFTGLMEINPSSFTRDGLLQGAPQELDCSSLPVDNVTWLAAIEFCRRLSNLPAEKEAGRVYRLPTEAEWEYACRAGTTTAYHFGDDVKKLDDYAWHGYNSEFIYHPVATRKPNPWGLYDMHGNVAEWVLDGFTDGYRKGIADGALNPWNIPITRYPRIVKGGSWDQDQDECRSAARLHSINDWKDTDPQVPKSIWYHTDGQHIGFRIVRPLKTPTPAEMHLYWNTDWWEPKRNAEDL